MGRSGYNYNSGISWFSQETWRTFAHEVGHNFGAAHSFEEGQGKTGGLMDYGDGKLNGKYQFNSKYRKEPMCSTIAGIAGTCPHMSDWLAKCGNSIIENDEECECADGSTSCRFCSMCKLTSGTQCSPESIHSSSCCSDAGEFKAPDTLCDFAGSKGYCSAGKCSLTANSICGNSWFGPFCGLNDNNECKASCEVGGKCDTLSRWKLADGTSANDLRDGTSCRVHEGDSCTPGVCSAGTCVVSANAPPAASCGGFIPTLPFSKPTPAATVKSTDNVSTPAPTPSPTFEPTLKPTLKPTPKPTPKATPKTTPKATPKPTFAPQIVIGHSLIQGVTEVELISNPQNRAVIEAGFAKALNIPASDVQITKVGTTSVASLKRSRNLRSLRQLKLLATFPPTPAPELLSKTVGCSHHPNKAFVRVGLADVQGGSTHTGGWTQLGCLQACYAEEKCRSFQFQPGSGRCELWSAKHEIAALSDAPGVDTYWCPSRGSVFDPVGCEEWTGYVFMGTADIQGGASKGYTLKKCYDECQSAANCKNFVFSPINGYCELWTGAKREQDLRLLIDKKEKPSKLIRWQTFTCGYGNGSTFSPTKFPTSKPTPVPTTAKATLRRNLNAKPVGVTIEFEVTFRPKDGAPVNAQSSADAIKAISAGDLSDLISAAQVDVGVSDFKGYVTQSPVLGPATISKAVSNTPLGKPAPTPLPTPLTSQLTTTTKPITTRPDEVVSKLVETTTTSSTLPSTSKEEGGGGGGINMGVIGGGAGGGILVLCVIAYFMCKPKNKQDGTVKFSNTEKEMRRATNIANV